MARLTFPTLGQRGTGLPDAAHEQLAPAAIDVGALTAAVSHGDAAAVESFYRRYFDRLLIEARRATRRDEAFCLDVVQDAVLKIIRSIQPVQSETQLIGWLKLVIRTAALDLMRGEKRRQSREQAAAIPERQTSEALDDREQMLWLQQEIAALDPQIVAMIEMRFHKHWTLSRMASWLGLSIGTIDGRLRRALATLRDRYQEVHDEG